MAYIAKTPLAYVGQSVGNGQCVAYTQKAANMPRTVAWKRGELVKGNMTIAPGTAIATFDADGRYGNHTDGRSRRYLSGAGCVGYTGTGSVDEPPDTSFW
jgi:hypothetical protein